MVEKLILLYKKAALRGNKILKAKIEKVERKNMTVFDLTKNLLKSKQAFEALISKQNKINHSAETPLSRKRSSLIIRKLHLCNLQLLKHIISKCKLRN